MLGYAALLGNVMANVPDLSFISSGMATKLEDMTDTFDDAFLFGDKTDPDLEPRKPQLMSAQIEVPQSASTAYRWKPLAGGRHIRLVTFTSLSEVDDLSRLDIASNPDTRTCEILSTSQPKQSFRVSIQTADLDSPNRPVYFAISYTWLDFPRSIPLVVSDVSEEKSASSSLDVKAVLPINASLHSFLQRLFSTASGTQSLTLWIDQICIDQTNDLEKSQQVRLMKDIFASADKTYIWLGETDEDSDLSVGALNSITDLTLGEAVHAQDPEALTKERSTAASLIKKADLRDPNSSTAHQRTAIGRLLNRPYFERAWIYQEAAVSRNAIIKIGNHELDFTKFSHAVGLYSEAEEDVQRNFGASLQRSTKGMATLGTIELGRKKLTSVPPPKTSSQDQQQENNGWTNLAFLNLLTRLAGTVKAKDDRDLIFAFLGFQDPSTPLIQPDYTSDTVSIYHRATRALIEDTGSLDALGIAGIDGQDQGKETKDTRLPNLASWCPDYRVRLPQGQPFALPGAPCGFNASKGRVHRARKPTSNAEPGDFLTIHGRRITEVTAVSDQGFSLTDRNRGGIGTFLKFNLHADWLDAHTRNLNRAFDDMSRMFMGGAFQQPQSQGEGQRDKTYKRLFRVMLADGGASDLSSSSASAATTTTTTAAADNPSSTPLPLTTYLQVLRREDSIRRANTFLPNLAELTAARQEIRRLMLVCYRKKLFLTDAGKLGLGPEAVKTGDTVAVLNGSRVPVVLRRAGAEETGGAVDGGRVGDGGKMKLDEKMAEMERVLRMIGGLGGGGMGGEGGLGGGNAGVGGSRSKGNNGGGAGSGGMGAGWEVVGQCYLEEWMDGGKVDWQDDEGDDMDLC